MFSCNQSELFDKFLEMNANFVFFYFISLSVPIKIP